MGHIRLIAFGLLLSLLLLTEVLAVIDPEIGADQKQCVADLGEVLRLMLLLRGEDSILAEIDHTSETISRKCRLF